jgi:hypothetical protein
MSFGCRRILLDKARRRSATVENLQAPILFRNLTNGLAAA